MNMNTLGKSGLKEEDLAKPILEVHKENAYIPAKTTYSPATKFFPGGESLLHDEDPKGSPQVLKTTAEKLLSALQMRSRSDDKRYVNALGNETVKMFRNRSAALQISFIDGIWNAVSDEYAYNTVTASMLDPEYALPKDDKEPLPTTWRQKADGHFEKRLAARVQPFNQYGIGFRTDGTTADDINRIRTRGMMQQRLDLNWMSTNRGVNIEGTVINRTTTPRFWSGNHDMFNETTISVSRNFFGATVFPRGHTGKAYLWAVDVAGTTGFDCEVEQLRLSTNWRPGEKAYSSIPTNKLLGYFEFQARGTPAGGGWMFEIPNGAKWAYLNNPSVEQKKYMEDELEVWRRPLGTLKNPVVIPYKYDFA